MAKERPVDLTAGDALPLGSRIRVRRHAQGVRLSRMARDLGYDKGYLSHVENNKAVPSRELLEKIAAYLELSVPTLQDAPLSQLTKGPTGHGAAPVALVPAALPVRPVQSRTLGQRIERLIAMAHVSAEEQEIIAERLVAVTRELLALVKAAQALRGTRDRPDA